MTTKQPEALPALIERFRGLHFDHAPDGWPAVRTREITALLDRITELESQLAQRFDAADMATAAAQGFRDGVAPLTAQAADSVQEDAARLDFLIEQRAYVVSDPDACPGHWLHWAMPDGRTWVQGDEHPTPRAAIDAARKQGARWQSAVRALTLHI